MDYQDTGATHSVHGFSTLIQMLSARVLVLKQADVTLYHIQLFVLGGRQVQLSPGECE